MLCILELLKATSFIFEPVRFLSVIIIFFFGNLGTLLARKVPFLLFFALLPEYLQTANSQHGTTGRGLQAGGPRKIGKIKKRIENGD